MVVSSESDTEQNSPPKKSPDPDPARSAPPRLPSRIYSFFAKPESGGVAFFFRIKNRVAAGWSEERLELLTRALETVWVLTQTHNNEKAVRKAKELWGIDTGT